MIEAKVSSLMIAHISALIRYSAKMISELEKLGLLSDVEAADIFAKLRSIYYIFLSVDRKLDGRKVTESVIILKDDDIKSYFLTKEIIISGEFEKQIIKPMLIHVLDKKSEHNHIQIFSFRKDFDYLLKKIMAAELTCSTL